MKQFLKLTVVLCGLFMVPIVNSQETHTVRGVGIQFKPEIVFANQGDVIEFRDMPTHFVDAVKIPEGADRMISKMGANYSYEIDKPGLYVYKCPPHWGARMGGLIVVGVGLQDEEGLVDTLTQYIETMDDKIGKGYLKKIIKKIKKGKIKMPG